MAKNRAIYILALIGAVIFSMLYTSKLSEVLLAILLLYPLTALIFTAVQLFSIKASFPNRRVVADKFSEFELFIDVKNISFLPCIPVELVCLTPDGNMGVFSEKQVFVSLPPFGKARLSLRCRHNFRGCYSCRIKKISAADPLRIIRLSRKLGAESIMIVLPRKLALDDIIKISGTEHSYAKKNPISSDKEDFSHVREYREGDIIQMVHWKLTAKQDELMIKQFDSINDRRALILCDRNGEGDVLPKTDAIIETAIAFAAKALKNGINSNVYFDDDYSSSVTSIPEFDSFFEMMAVMPAAFEPMSFAELCDRCALNSGGLSGLSVLVIVTAELTEEIIAAARSASGSCAVFLAYVNITEKPVNTELYDNADFFFLNIRGTDPSALDTAVVKLKDSLKDR